MHQQFRKDQKNKEHLEKNQINFVHITSCFILSKPKITRKVAKNLNGFIFENHSKSF